MNGSNDLAQLAAVLICMFVFVVVIAGVLYYYITKFVVKTVMSEQHEHERQRLNFERQQLNFERQQLNFVWQQLRSLFGSIVGCTSPGQLDVLGVRLVKI